MYIFLSHSSSDAQTATKICTMLENNGHSCFIAPRDIQAGREYAEEIMNGIDQSDICLLLLSEKSNHSPHVLREIERAVSKAIPVFVYQLEEVVLTKSMEYFLMTHQWMNTNHSDDITVILSELEDYQQREDTIREEKKAGRPGKTNEKAPNHAIKKNTKKRKFIVGIIVTILAAFAVVGMCLFKKNLGKDRDKNVEVPVIDVEIGDVFSFGSYYGEPIEWQVLRFSEDGEEAYLITKDVIGMKAFDAAESGTYEYAYYQEDGSRIELSDASFEQQIAAQGNNSWELSNIRTWLNSDEENVIYEDMPPYMGAVELYNDYFAEPGFLTGFREDEIEAILTKEIHTPGNVMSGRDDVVTKDKVFLLSSEELNWLKEANISIYGSCSEQAKVHNEDQDGDGTFYYYNGEYVNYWLRDPVKENAYIPYQVGCGEEKELLSDRFGACFDEVGVRPVVCVNLDQFKRCVAGERDTGKADHLQLGDHYLFGSYYNEPIEWRVLQISEDGRTAILVTQDLITAKAFDVSEDGEAHWVPDSEEKECAKEELIGMYGNSSYGDSNLRTWLNSSEINVTYLDQAPIKDATNEHKNAYSAEPGFLTGFSSEEKDILVERKVSTKTNDLKDAVEYETTFDLVFLLSSEELEWFEQANVNRYATFTRQAREHDEARMFEDIFEYNDGCDYHFYWLRDSFEGSVFKVKVVNNDFKMDLISSYDANMSGIGVRPAITVSTEQFLEYINGNE